MSRASSPLIGGRARGRIEPLAGLVDFQVGTPGAGGAGGRQPPLDFDQGRLKCPAIDDRRHLGISANRQFVNQVPDDDPTNDRVACPQHFGAVRFLGHGHGQLLSSIGQAVELVQLRGSRLIGERVEPGQ